VAPPRAADAPAPRKPEEAAREFCFDVTAVPNMPDMSVAELVHALQRQEAALTASADEWEAVHADERLNLQARLAALEMAASNRELVKRSAAARRELEAAALRGAEEEEEASPPPQEEEGEAEHAASSAAELAALLYELEASRLCGIQALAEVRMLRSDIIGLQADNATLHANGLALTALLEAKTLEEAAAHARAVTATVASLKIESEHTKRVWEADATQRATAMKEKLRARLQSRNAAAARKAAVSGAAAAMSCELPLLPAPEAVEPLSLARRGSSSACCDAPMCPHEHEQQQQLLRLCSRCKTVRYCSAACQALAWRTGHKQECAQLVAAADGA
jgi:hypothetical protein